MKVLKLKPIFFPNDDILVKPPEFIVGEEIQIEKLKNKTISSTDQLKSIIRGRQLKKQNTLKANLGEEDKEAVKKLSEWKSIETQKSNLKRKFTFKRGMTMNFSPDGKMGGTRSFSVVQTVIPVKKSAMEILSSSVQGIVATERLKRKVLEEEVKQISERNKQYEENIRAKLNRSVKDMETLKQYIRENKEKLEKVKKEFADIEKLHEEKLVEINMKEAQELLFNDKNRKRAIKPGDESQYFIKKEKFRQLKQELHKKYQENKEFYTNKLDTIKRGIDISTSHRLECKKELTAYNEEMVMLYCRALKDGKDIRADGLKWIIKSLWNMNECIPLSAFPKFFDDDSSHFLLMMAEKDLELQEYVKKLDKVRKDIKNKRNSLSVTTSKDLYKTVRSRLRNISQSSVGQLIDGTKCNEGQEVIVPSKSKEENSNYSEITSLREKITATNESVKELTTQEIIRITENYQANPGEAEKVGLFHVIKCLVGDKVREFNKYTRSSGPKARKVTILG